MRTRSKLVLAGLTAALLLSMGVANASARNLSVDEQFFRVTWTSLEFVNSEFGVRVLCPTTLEGSFHTRTIAKVLRSLIGYITRAIVKRESCTNGSATVLTETLPWHITYEGFRGTLPIITALRVLLRRPSFRVLARTFIGNIECLSQPENILGTINGTFVSGAFKPETLEADPNQRFPCGSFFEGEFVGRGTVTRLGQTTRILVTLI